MGSWRLAYLFIDESEDLEEDNTCVITELMQVNETQFDLLLYMDGKKDEQTIERSTTEFRVTFLSPGEWALHAPLAGKSKISFNQSENRLRPKLIFLLIFESSWSNPRYRYFLLGKSHDHNLLRQTKQRK